MTSQLNVDTIVDKAGSGGTNVKIANTSVTVAEGGSGTTNTVQGLVKAWVNFNGTGTIAARDSFNVSSLTDSGAGKYDINYNSNMNNSLYVVATLANGLDGNDDGNSRISSERKSNTRSTSMTPVHSGDWFYASGASLEDVTHFYSSTNGDLA